MSRIADSIDLRDYVKVYENILSNDTCDSILSWAKQLKDSDHASTGWEVAKSAVTNEQIEVTEHRTCHTTMFTQDHGVEYDVIQQKLQHIRETYPYMHKATFDTGLQLIRYQQGHKFKEHIDHYGGGQRTLTVIFLINDDYEGGHFTFWNNFYSLKNCVRGDAIVFPSNLCFPHQVKPITQGVRYSLITWML
jgi:predicted 2-oxoglutarate/Fe(II)-dependent dioxygenase YbiX|tara:strand:- start:24 stop:599 length:576 start_codon:yes stop_codon:yes gene_type:complete